MANLTLRRSPFDKKGIATDQLEMASKAIYDSLMEAFDARLKALNEYWVKKLDEVYGLHHKETKALQDAHTKDLATIKSLLGSGIHVKAELKMPERETTTEKAIEYDKATGRPAKVVETVKAKSIIPNS